MLDLKEMFTPSQLKTLKDDLYRRLEDWTDYAEHFHSDDTSKEHMTVLLHLINAIYDEFSKERVERYAVYQKEYDLTFIMEEVWLGDCLDSMECIGWHCGEPYDGSIETFGNRIMKSML